MPPGATEFPDASEPYGSPAFARQLLESSAWRERARRLAYVTAGFLDDDRARRAVADIRGELDARWPGKQKWPIRYFTRLWIDLDWACALLMEDEEPPPLFEWLLAAATLDNRFVDLARWLGWRAKTEAGAWLKEALKEVYLDGVAGVDPVARQGARGLALGDRAALVTEGLSVARASSPLAVELDSIRLPLLRTLGKVALKADKGGGMRPARASAWLERNRATVTLGEVLLASRSDPSTWELNEMILASDLHTRHRDLAAETGRLPAVVPIVVAGDGSWFDLLSRPSERVGTSTAPGGTLTLPAPRGAVLIDPVSAAELGPETHGFSPSVLRAMIGMTQPDHGPAPDPSTNPLGHELEGALRCGVTAYLCDLLMEQKGLGRLTATLAQPFDYLQFEHPLVEEIAHASGGDTWAFAVRLSQTPYPYRAGVVAKELIGTDSAHARQRLAEALAPIHDDLVGGRDVNEQDASYRAAVCQALSDFR